MLHMFQKKNEDMIKTKNYNTLSDLRLGNTELL